MEGSAKNGRGRRRWVHSHPLYFDYSHRVPILTPAETRPAVPRPPFPVPSSRNSHVRPPPRGATAGDRRGGARAGAGRCARESGSKPRVAWPRSPPPLRVDLGALSPTSSRRRQACARPRAAPRPGRSAGSAGLVATASPWLRGGGGAAVARAGRRRSPAPEVPPGAGTPTRTRDPGSGSLGAGSGPAWGGEGWRCGFGAPVPGL